MMMKTIGNIFLCLFFTCTTMTAQKATAEAIVQANLDAYNKGDIDGFMSYFSSEIEMFNFADGTQTAKGLTSVRAIYEPYFKASPDLHSTIIQRVVIGNKVIDHESITGRYGSDDVLKLVLIYEVEEGKITKVTVIRA